MKPEIKSCYHMCRKSSKGKIHLHYAVTHWNFFWSSQFCLIMFGESEANSILIKTNLQARPDELWKVQFKLSYNSLQWVTLQVWTSWGKQTLICLCVVICSNFVLRVCSSWRSHESNTQWLILWCSIILWDRFVFGNSLDSSWKAASSCKRVTS